MLNSWEEIVILNNQFHAELKVKLKERYNFNLDEFAEDIFLWSQDHPIGSCVIHAVLLHVDTLKDRFLEWADARNIEVPNEDAGDPLILSRFRRLQNQPQRDNYVENFDNIRSDVRQDFGDHCPESVLAQRDSFEECEERLYALAREEATDSVVDHQVAFLLDEEIIKEILFNRLDSLFVDGVWCGPENSWAFLVHKSWTDILEALTHDVRFNPLPVPGITGYLKNWIRYYLWENVEYGLLWKAWHDSEPEHRADLTDSNGQITHVLNCIAGLPGMRGNLVNLFVESIAEMQADGRSKHWHNILFDNGTFTGDVKQKVVSNLEANFLECSQIRGQLFYQRILDSKFLQERTARGRGGFDRADFPDIDFPTDNFYNRQKESTDRSSVLYDAKYFLESLQNQLNYLPLECSDWEDVVGRMLKIFFLRVLFLQGIHDTQCYSLENQKFLTSRVGNTNAGGSDAYFRANANDIYHDVYETMNRRNFRFLLIFNYESKSSSYWCGQLKLALRDVMPKWYRKYNDVLLLNNEDYPNQDEDYPNQDEDDPNQDEDDPNQDEDDPNQDEDDPNQDEMNFAVLAGLEEADPPRDLRFFCVYSDCLALKTRYKDQGQEIYVQCFLHRLGRAPCPDVDAETRERYFRIVLEEVTKILREG